MDWPNNKYIWDQNSSDLLQNDVIASFLKNGRFPNDVIDSVLNNNGVAK